MKRLSFVFLILFYVVSSGYAQEGPSTRFLQLAIFPPLQLAPSNADIVGLRLGLISKNVNVTGIDIGLVNWATGESTAVKWGFFNITKNLKGIQIGLLNIATGKETLPVLPIINASF